jgi:arginine decarboxylase
MPDSPLKKKKKPVSRESTATSKKGWSPSQSAELYGIDDWGHGYFHVSRQGETTVRLIEEGEE